MLGISDIAKHVGVSVTTVSLVLNDAPSSSRFSAKTRQEVLQAAEELGYRSNRMARAMRTGNTRMLGVLGGKPVEEHVGRMLQGALEAADDQGYTLKVLRLHAIGGDPQQAIRSISELRLMGVLALHLPDSTLEELHVEAVKSGTPLVLMDTHSINPDIPQVASDDDAGFAMGVDYLVKLGHSKIAFIGGGGETAIGTSRRAAFKQALKKHGLVFNDEYYREGSYHIKAPSIEAARSLLSLPREKRPTAIFCASDFMAMAALKVAHELHIEVPSELSVIGFANFSMSDYASPALTTIEQPFIEMGRTAVNLLLDMIREREEEHSNTAQASVDNTLVVNGHIFKEASQAKARNSGDKSRLHNIRLLPTRLIERESVAAAPIGMLSDDD